LSLLHFIVQSKTHVPALQKWGRKDDPFEGRGSLRKDRWEGNILTMLQPTTVLESSLARFKTFYVVCYLDYFFLAPRDDWITVNEPSDAIRKKGSSLNKPRISSHGTTMALELNRESQISREDTAPL